MVRASLLYVGACAVVAICTGVLGGRQVSGPFWVAGALALLIVLVRGGNRRARDAGQPMSIVEIAIAVLVSVAAAYLALVVMVNIWQRLGIPH